MRLRISGRWQAAFILGAAIAGLVLAAWAGRLRVALATGFGLFAAASGTDVDLGRYRVAVEAHPVAGLGRNLSGLTYNEETATLFATINRPAAVAEISRDGQLLRQWPLPTEWDAEGITHLTGDRFIVADENGNRLHWIRVTPHDTGITHDGTLRLGWASWPNLGVEGISWDQHRGELWLVNEKWPRRIVTIAGLGPDHGAGAAVIHEWRPQGPLGLLGGDLASVTVHGASGNLLLLSEESAVIVEYRRDGRLVGAATLASGAAGLGQPVPQAEGIAIAPDGDVFIVSEPNLFYRFAPR